MDKCLVTGATGFIGRHVINQMLAAGRQVIAIGRQTSPFDDHADLCYHKADLQNLSEIEALMDMYKPERLVHLAWEATPGKFWNSTDNFKWVALSAALLNSFVQQGGKKAVLAGSCAEYRWHDDTLLEEQSDLNPHTLYSASKDAFRRMAVVIAHDIDVVWARVFFPYGPDEAPSKLVSFISKEISEGREPVFQSATRAVDLIHVEDVARAFERLTFSDISGAVNICSGTAWLPYDIALLCAEIMGQEKMLAPLKEKVQQIHKDISVLGSPETLYTVLGEADIRPLKVGLMSYLSGS